MAKRSRYQEKIIRNYYDNRDTLAMQRAQELVTDLYLASGKKRQQHWRHLKTHLKKLGVTDQELASLEQRDDPREVARLVQQLSARS